MQIHQIELVPGESIRVGTMVVTLVAVDEGVAHLHIDGPSDDACWLEPLESSGIENGSLACV